jgi:hypothetical protein
MKKRTLGLTIVTALALTITPAAAKKCSVYERQVYEIAQVVAKFRHSDQFVNVYGWAVGGPFSKWLKRIQALQDDTENVRKLMGEHGFTPMDIHSVADAYRTAGGLDAFYQGVENSVNGLKCK